MRTCSRSASSVGEAVTDFWVEQTVGNESKIRAILKEHGRLAKDVDTLDDNADLYQAGMTSHASVNVMLALEGEFDVEFPDEMLKRSSFESIAAIASVVDSLTAASA